jgi:hypothetical protein
LVTLILIYCELGNFSDGIYLFEGLQMHADQDEDILSCQQEADLDLGAVLERDKLNLQLFTY